MASGAVEPMPLRERAIVRDCATALLDADRIAPIHACHRDLEQDRGVAAPSRELLSLVEELGALRVIDLLPRPSRAALSKVVARLSSASVRVPSASSSIKRATSLRLPPISNQSASRLT